MSARPGPGTSSAGPGWTAVDVSVEDRVVALRACPLMAHAGPELLVTIAERAEALGVPGQGCLIRQGEPGDAMFVVVRGRLRVVWQNEHGAPVVLADYERGGFVGELALLTADPRRASVYAVRNSTVLRLGRDQFNALLADAPRAGAAMALEVARRLTAGLDRDPSHASVRFRTVALVPACEPAVADAFEDGFARALGALGRVIRIGRDVRPASPERMGDILERHAQAGAFVVIRVEDDDEPGRRSGLWQVDLVLVLADGSRPLRAPAAPGVADAYVESVGAVRLVAIGGAESRRGCVRSWRGQGQRGGHHHIGAVAEGELARLLRLLTGQAVGFAFSGGGPRAASFVGAVRALAEAGIEPDIVSGTSAGAIVAAMAARGWDWQTMRDAMLRFQAAPWWRAVGPPVVSLMSGRVLNAVLRDLFGELDLQDTLKPVRVVCASLESGREVVLTAGPAWRAVRASMCLPGVWPPMPWGEDRLIDGGLLNNLPVGPLLEYCGGGRIIAADLQTLQTPAWDGLAVEERSGWRALWSRLNPFRARAARIGPLDVIIRASCLTSRARARAERAHVGLLLQPLTGAPSGLDVSEMVSYGYEKTRAALEGRAEASAP